nr:reverse transcriptase domain-containing protein [Tanacetum cinerariifolium]
MTNQAILDSDSYKTYYAIATGAEPPKPKKTQKKSDSAISSEETPSKKKPAKAKKDVPSTKKLINKPKPTKKKAPVKADRGKGLNVLSKVALSEAVQLKEATRRSKKDFHISHSSGSGDGTDFVSGVPDEQQCKISGTNKGTGTKPRVLDVPKYDFKSEKESWGDSGQEDDDEEDTEDESEMMSNKEHEEEEEKEEEYADERVHTPKNYELTNEEDNAKKENEEEKDDAEELYKDVKVNLRKENVEMTDAGQGGAYQHSVSQVSGFEQVEEDAHVTLILTELEYHFEECYKATTDRLDWHNPKVKQYPFDLCKPLPLIPNHRGRHVIPFDYFINNDLEYLKGGSLSRKYSTFVTKTKAATYEVQWIEDMVPNIWSLVKGRHNHRRSKQPFILEESPVDTMAHQLTMVELLRAPTEGYAEATAVPPILAEQFELKHSLINMITSDQFFRLEKDNPHDYI